MKKLLSFAMVFFFLQQFVLAQYPEVTLHGSEIRTITSAIVAGQEYQLQISLPGGYKNSNKKYPVIYVMDSQWDFPLVTSIYGQQYFDGFIPEVIIVGVTWEGNHPNPDSLRARDYTPTMESRLPQSGGADKFLSFMKDELFPFIESNYKADSENRTLVGCSLGGLFTLYTLFTHTDMFTGYAAASPAIGWDKEVLYKYEKIFVEKKLTKPVRVYMTVGDVERGKPVFEKFAGFMQNRNYSNVKLKSKVLENTGHSGTKSETYTRGLQFVFEKNKLRLIEAVLNKYVGIYETTDGNKIEIKNENNELIWYYSSENKFVLFANDETQFYATHEFFNVYFKWVNGKIEGLDLNRYGGTQIFNKTK
ncbi:MAG: alpha/beta hydrolase-fold protein [Ferruginibacter sp.]